MIPRIQENAVKPFNIIIFSEDRLEDVENLMRATYLLAPGFFLYHPGKPA
jgi:hypothetical protein